MTNFNNEELIKSTKCMLGFAAVSVGAAIYGWNVQKDPACYFRDVSEENYNQYEYDRTKRDDDYNQYDYKNRYDGTTGVTDGEEDYENWDDVIGRGQIPDSNDYCPCYYADFAYGGIWGTVFTWISIILAYTVLNHENPAPKMVAYFGMTILSSVVTLAACVIDVWALINEQWFSSRYVLSGSASTVRITSIASIISLAALFVISIRASVLGGKSLSKECKKSATSVNKPADSRDSEPLLGMNTTDLLGVQIMKNGETMLYIPTEKGMTNFISETVGSTGRTIIVNAGDDAPPTEPPPWYHH